jgi:hypothetical protein
MVNIPITDIKLKNTFISLNNNNLSGFDEIPNKMVQVGGKCISKLLAYIFFELAISRKISRPS